MMKRIQVCVLPLTWGLGKTEDEKDSGVYVTPNLKISVPGAKPVAKAYEMFRKIKN